MKTDAEWNAWLADDNAIPVVIAEVAVRVGAVETIRYLSTVPFDSAATDTPANQTYEAVLSPDLNVNESLAVDSTAASMAVGDIGIGNLDGERDEWLMDVWANRGITLRFGDVRWTRDDLREVFVGANADIGAKSRNELGLKLRDKLIRLNASATEAKIGGTGPAKDTLVPTALGENFNVSPLVTGPNEFQVHSGTMEEIKEVRDNGVGPIPFTPNYTTGKFTLNQAAAGTITCDVQGDKVSGVYNNTVAKLIERLVTGYGKSSDRFTTADLDTAQLAAFDALHQQPVGIMLTDRANVINVCRDLASSVGAQVAMSRLGKLRLLKLAAPGTPKMTITPAQMVKQDLAPVSRTEVVAAVKLGFNKNWTKQDVVAGLSAVDKEDFAREWLESVATDSTTATVYKLSTEPVQQDTMLLKRTHADAEALRLLNMRKVPRTVYQFTGLAPLMALELGDTVTLQHPRFGLAAGVPGVVVSINTAWARRRVTLGVLI